MPDPKQAKVTKDFAHEAPLITCRFDPKARWLFACSEDRNVIRWEVESGKKTVLSGHGSWPMALAVTADGSTLISGAGDDSLIWWPAAEAQPKPLRTVKAHEGWIRALVISPDGTLLASAGNDRVIRLWRVADGTAAGEIKGHESDIYSLLFHPSGKFLISGDLAGKVIQWEVPGGKQVQTFDATKLHAYDGGQQVHYGGVRGLALSPDGKWLAAAGHHKSTNPLGNVQEPLIVRFAWEDAKPAGQHLGTDDMKNHTLWGAEFHPDGWLVAVAGGGGGHLLFWNHGEEKPFHRHTLPNTARGMHIQPGGSAIATAHHDRKVRISTLGA